jgi:hypothetical protein
MINAVKKTNDAFHATCFQLHKSMLIEVGSCANIIDFTEKKLIRDIDNSKDALKKLLLVAMLEDYTSGKIAISWKKGVATYTRIQDGK